ncbi:malate transporter [Klebsiella michiganensis]|uniref:Malate transporter n=1 Tax=Enterobacter wuhouensis TaxID=2529381 RepID=A0A4R0GDK5_9ENTR|nr:malate transporter [Klebsiella michiganensis]TCB94192.1 malate transporter [Enterobacter wuhouensis]HDS8779871.1 malate transporter [Klebsiella michiganensis]HDX8747327.1 malate transporter [Klebsiella michiganensis]HDX9090017.1 malate transporter [Klebsiella michiganensis]
MKLPLTVEADTINVLALNAGRIAVDIDGIELADLINVVCDNGYSLRVADEPGKLVVEDPLPPVAHVNCIQCSTAHITAEDNALLFTLSHQYEDFGESEWISYTGSGYLLHLGAWSFPARKKSTLIRKCSPLSSALL